MAKVGLKMVRLALLDDDGKIIADADKGLSADGVFDVTDKMLGTKTANMTNVEGSVTKIYGNNHVVDNSVAPGEPQVALDFNDLPFVALQKILGRKSDGKGGYTQGAKPRVALMIESETINRKNRIFYCFGDGIVQEATVNTQTDTNQEQRSDDTPTYYANACENFNGEPYKVYSDIDPKFDEPNMYKEVFGGYVKTTAGDTDVKNQGTDATGGVAGGVTTNNGGGAK